MSNQNKLTIYDTTLRDGNQALGISLSLSDKLRIAQRLSDLGFNYIEGGWPNPTNAVDTEFFKKVRRLNLAAKVAVFGSTKRPGRACGDDPFLQMLVKSEAPVATIFGKSWDLHVKKVIRLGLQENLDMIAETVSHLKRHMGEVIYDAEHFFDGYRHNSGYALQTLRAAREAGADLIVLCDTNGGMLPDEFLATFCEVKNTMGCRLGVHTHNDSGCADANAILAVCEGAVQVQGTINGLGERCGNANLCTILPDLQLKRGFRLLSDACLRQLTEVSIFVDEVANVSHNMRQPYVGECAFSHKAGAHADGVRKT
jgi:2-isopropylmalate synthase